MISGGIKVNSFAEIRLILVEKFGNCPYGVYFSYGIISYLLLLILMIPTDSMQQQKRRDKKYPKGFKI